MTLKERKREKKGTQKKRTSKSRTLLMGQVLLHVLLVIWFRNYQFNMNSY